MGGYSLECAVKMRLCVDRREESLDPQLCNHDIRGLAENLSLWHQLKANELLMRKFVYLLGEWRVDLRYTERMMQAEDVKIFISRAREVCRRLLEN